MNNSMDKLIQEFDKELQTYEKQHNIEFGTNSRTKIADNYAMTMLTEKDIEPLEWIEENITDILESYKEDIFLKK